MIGSFWNLCRACPSMPVDKLHSEYRSTYRWHEYTGGPEVVRKPPVPNQFASINEPPLPRRKKCPELAYRSHEFMSSRGQEHAGGTGGAQDRPDAATTHSRARSEERGTPSRRSKSEGPPGVANGRLPTGTGIANGTHEPVSVEGGGRVQQQAANAHELEPLVNDVEAERPQHEKRDMATVVEHKLKAYRSDKEKFGFEPELDAGGDGRAHAGSDSTWYKEVIELRKKAGEYKSRGWGVEMNPELFNKQQELWEQVSRRSSLSALSLASSVRPITKEEKEKENNKKSSPTKPHAGGRGKFPGSARPVDMGRTLPDGLAFSRSRKDNVRHHLERTTGVEMEEGALLPSPTREKLMPAIPRSKGDSPQRGSPQKTGLSRHGSPQKGSPQKSSPKKTSNKGRSQSVGPTVASDGSTVGTVGGGSPKRQIRSGSTATASTASSAAKAHNKKTPTTTATTPSSQPERRPRPTTLSTTTNHSRSKSNTLPQSSGAPRVHSAPPSRPQPATNNNNNNINNNNNMNNNSNVQNNNTNNNHLPNQTQQTSSTTAKTNQKPDQGNNNNSIPNNNYHPSPPTSAPSTTTTTTTSQHPSRAKLTLGSKIGSHPPPPPNRPRTASTTRAADPGQASAATGPGSALKKAEPPRKLAVTGHARPKLGTKPNQAAGTEEDAEKDNCISVSSASPLPAPEINEQIIKSPPEPTRVKSPEQIIMRSPDPVNWTVPLDTGKTFTVTQNVREGDPMMRPHSEIKASTPVEPPPAPQSAPPELAEQSKMPSSKLEPDSIKESEDEEDEDLLKSKSSVTSSANPVSVTIPAVGPASTTTASAAPSAAATAETTTTKAPATAEPAQSTPAPEVPRFDKPVPGSTLRCLDDPTFDTADINSPVTNRNVASDVLDKARDRFDRFWGNPDGSKPDEP